MVAYCFSSAHAAPLAAGIMLYQLIGKLDEQRSFADYMSASKEISAAETYLQKPELYHFNSTRDERELNALTSDALKIELFSPNGVLIYSSMIDSQYTEFVQTTESLYAKLYQTQINPRSYVMKNPCSLMVRSQEYTGSRWPGMSGKKE